MLALECQLVLAPVWALYWHLYGTCVILTCLALLCQDVTPKQKQKLYEEAARVGNAEAAVQSGDPFRDSAEASLDLLLQEQQQKLRVRSTFK